MRPMVFSGTILVTTLLLGLATITWAAVEEPARRFGIRLAKRAAA